MRRPVRALLPAILAGFVYVPVANSGVLYTAIQVAGSGPLDTRLDVNRPNSSETAASLTDTESYTSPSEGGSVFVQSSFGVLKAEARARAGGSAFGSFRALGVSSFLDPVTVSSPGLEGQSGLLSVIVQYERSLSALGVTSPSFWDDQSYANATLQFSADAASWNYREFLGTLTPDNNLCSRLFAPNCQLRTAVTSLESSIGVEALADDRFRLSIPFQFGREFNLFIELRMEAVAQTGSTQQVSYVADAANSWYWGGVSSVTDSAGRSVDTFSLASGSGTDWSRSYIPTAVPDGSVPTPGTLLLLGLGLSVGLAAAAKGRRATTNPLA